MLRKVINPILILPLALSISSQNILASETRDNSDKILEEKLDKTFIKYKEIKEIILENLNLWLLLEEKLKKGSS